MAKECLARASILIAEVRSHKPKIRCPPQDYPQAVKIRIRTTILAITMPTECELERARPALQRKLSKYPQGIPKVICMLMCLKNV